LRPAPRLVVDQGTVAKLDDAGWRPLRPVTPDLSLLL